MYIYYTLPEIRKDIEKKTFFDKKLYHAVEDKSLTTKE